MVGALLDSALTDWAADLRAGRIGSAGWAGGVEPAWAASGAMALTGQPDGPPLGLTVPLVARLDAALAVIRTLAAGLGHPFPPADASTGGAPPSAGPLLGERAAALGLTRGGVLSAGRAARLVQAADGWLAVNLARPDDVDLLPAWLEAEVEPTAADRAADVRPVAERTVAAPVRPWTNLAALVATRPAASLVERAELLGLAVSLAVDPAAAAADEQARARGQRFPFAPFLVDGLPPEAAARAAPRRPEARRDGGFSVVDLSSLWAGPLCAQLLGLAGGQVVKVEGAGRLDGARQGPPDFYDLLHAGQASVTVDLRAPAGRAALVGLIERADVVLEASRPRALETLGIDPTAMIARNPRLTWVSITGYGRTGPWRQRPAFGDDAAAAAGAVAVDGAGGPVFLGDAIADPVTGVLAAAGALASVAAGGGHHLDVALREAVGSLLAGRPVLPDRDPTAADGSPVRVAPPRLRAPRGRAAPAGQDNDRLLAGAGPSTIAGQS
ncbi:L-carnitine dehydratase/bile acid-inducible protein F [Pseudofrankia inefficax]|uniref:L-carnitine dehydratase/bile acid-inducible protein F n=2 Tax=Pseudofrankia inefficax (strain DSM 45817 / CECT 9037 / DDB 130130 / EuI1c) TaxID=298654 RepID=E3J707_PSEI1|nr:L-carnitine dehydratase/bile acid-inducible protein F [Pseudofrankia inefficax]